MYRWRCCSARRSRIWAWTVTSSAGGGLVGEQQLRATGQRDGDDDPLAHATRHLVRVRLEALLGLGDLHRPQQLDGRGLGLVLVHVEVEAQ